MEWSSGALWPKPKIDQQTAGIGVSISLRLGMVSCISGISVRKDRWFSYCIRHTTRSLHGARRREQAPKCVVSAR